jgi:hypothetical protein
MHGAAKAGKSTLAYQLAKALATHTSFLKPEWRADRPYKTVYIQADAGATEWQEFLKEEDAPVGQITDLDFGCFYDFKTRVALRDTVKELQAEVLIIDSVYKIKDGNTNMNEADGVTSLLRAIRSIYDGPYVLIHHSRKHSVGQPRDVIESAAGHHTLTANASAVWYLTRSDKGTHGELSYMGRGIQMDKLTLERLPNGMWKAGMPPVDDTPVRGGGIRAMWD